MPSQNEVKKYVRALQGRGIPVALELRKKHMAVLLNGQLVSTLPATPGSHRWKQNLNMHLRKAGVDMNGEPKAQRAKEREVRRAMTASTQMTQAAPQKTLQQMYDEVQDHVRLPLGFSRLKSKAPVARVMATMEPFDSETPSAVDHRLRAILSGELELTAKETYAVVQAFQKVLEMKGPEIVKIVKATVKTGLGGKINRLVDEMELTGHGHRFSHVYRAAEAEAAKQGVKLIFDQEKGATQKLSNLASGWTDRSYNRRGVEQMLELARAALEREFYTATQVPDQGLGHPDDVDPEPTIQELAEVLLPTTPVPIEDLQIELEPQPEYSLPMHLLVLEKALTGHVEASRLIMALQLANDVRLSLGE